MSSNAAPRAIRSIVFRRSPDGAGRVIVRLSDAHTPVNVHQVGSQIVADFSGAELPSTLMRRYDATDYGTPITGFDVQRAGTGVRIVVDAVGDYEQLAYQ